MNKPNYTRLDDDVSFQILRTNPRLTTNTKVVYDGENLYMDSFDAVPLLSTVDYKHHKVWKTGLFNRDIRNFLLGTNTAAYAVGQEVQNTIMPDNFDDQFETMYWCGVESINSKAYPQEMGCIAPLYLRKKLPRYFVIFKIDNPVNINLVPGDKRDETFDFESDVRSKSKIVKTFDLREGTPIGDYIRRYVEQRDFKYDQSIYVNFSSNEIYYYGIDKKSGVLAQKVENFEEQLLKNDNTIMRMDDWITSGFERNNLIFPYIINFEFLFDDKEIEEYKFARYFGMYCNDIDLFDIEVVDNISNFYESDRMNILMTKTQEDTSFDVQEKAFYYVKDKYSNMYSIKKNNLPGYINVYGNIDRNNFMGFEPESISTYAERIDGFGRSTMMFKINKVFNNNEKVEIESSIYDDNDQIVTHTFTFTAKGNLNPGTANGYEFSCNGKISDNAQALSSAIRSCIDDALKWVTSFNIEDKVVIRSTYPGSSLNKMFSVTSSVASRITLLTDGFGGGTDIGGCLFKINASDVNVFFDQTGEDRDPYRYLKSNNGRDNAKVLMKLPYINDDLGLEEDYYVIVTDEHGPQVVVSRTEQVEIIDKFYPKIGVLSFFPVKDFDFDTVSSAYGKDTAMQNELGILDQTLELIKRENSGEIADSDSDLSPGIISTNMKYNRFYHYNGNPINTEYEYYFENIIPELSAVSKSVPTITKWGYIDEGKDSCENPYRLNTSKIFEACNFSANTFMQKGDIMEYTHSMPYYVSNLYGLDNENLIGLKNEYQYIQVDDDLWNASLIDDNQDEVLNKWRTYLSRTDINPFEELFADTSRSQYGSKRFNKKYSRFLTGNDINRASTLFRGVKFEITELKNGKEVHTGKYNGYKFSFIYVPFSESVADSDSDEKSTSVQVYFIKNEKYKFIVGLVLFGMKNSLKKWDFNKAYVYAGCMGYMNPKELNEN